MTFGKFAFYVILFYIIYFGIIILLETIKSKRGVSIVEEKESYDLSNMIDDEPQNVDELEKSDELQAFEKKNE